MCVDAFPEGLQDLREKKDVWKAKKASGRHAEKEIPAPHSGYEGLHCAAAHSSWNDRNDCDLIGGQKAHRNRPLEADFPRKPNGSP
jgi:hypothetical protein